ncbi:kinase-like domain-containing protein [Chlamydoabsidia padenii]|nr:kinase-like domain-containing protein [Chlamydoabsidia padenii]
MQHTTIFSAGAQVDDLEIVQLLGTGAYGQVYLGLDRNKQQQYAIKSLLRQPHNKHTATTNAKENNNAIANRHRGFQRMEIGLHARLSGHPHIVKLDRVIRGTNYTHLVMEYAPEGDLFTAITERDLFAGNHPLIRRVFLQLLEAVEHCHLNGVYHRDLKSENVLVFDGGRTIKLADFGLATLDTISTDYGCGSTFYFSPECQGDLAKQRQQRVGYATGPNDIWALGVILINLAAGRNPWKQASLKDETFRAYLADPDFLLKILPISRELNRILKRIFCIDPLRRIGLKELKHRIQQCKYFTRTAEVDRWERLQDLEFINNNSNSYLYNNNISINTKNLFDIPPYTRKAATTSPPIISSDVIPTVNDTRDKKKRTTPMGPVTTSTTDQRHCTSKRPAVNLPPSPPATPRDRSQQSHDGNSDICMNTVDSTSGNPATNGLLPNLVPSMA